MKVLMFGWEFPPFKTGGLGTACYGLTKGLRNMGVEVAFVIPRSGDVGTSEHVRLVGTTNANKVQTKTEPRTEEYNHVKLVRVDVSLEPYARPVDHFEVHITRHQKTSHVEISNSEEPDKSAELYGEDLFTNIQRYTAKAGNIARDEKFDVIHAHDWMTYQAGMAASKASGKPLVVHVHATEYDRTGGHGVNPVIRDIEQMGARAAHRVIAVSNRTKQTLMRYYGISAKKISVVYNAINASDHAPDILAKRYLKKKIVLFLGRITIQKGPEYFLEAASKVLEEEPNTMFIMAGSGDMMYKMVERASDLNIGHKVLFPGFVEGAALNRIYDMADVYVMPSVSEPFGIVPLEAMSHGVPTIISKQSGVSEMVNNALKVDFWDIDGLANGMVALLRYGALWNSLRRNGSSEMGRLSWDNSASQCVGVYQKVSGKISPPRGTTPPMIEYPRRVKILSPEVSVTSGDLNPPAAGSPTASRQYA